MNKEQLTPILIQFLDELRDYIHESHTDISNDDRESSEFVELFFSNQPSKEQLTPEELFNTITSNGMREMTKERFIQALSEYSNQPSEEKSNSPESRGFKTTSKSKEEIYKAVFGDVKKCYHFPELESLVLLCMDATEEMNQSKCISVEELSKMKKLAHEGLPNKCLDTWNEVTFCKKRQGNGNECKECSHYM